MQSERVTTNEQIPVSENPLIEASKDAVGELQKAFPDARLTMLFKGPDNIGIQKGSDFTSQPKDELIFMASIVKPLIAAAVLQSLGGKSGEKMNMNMSIPMRWVKGDGKAMNKFSGEEQIWVDLLNKDIVDPKEMIAKDTLPDLVTLQQTLDAVLGNSVNGAIGAWYQLLESKGIENPQDVVQAYVNELSMDKVR